MPKLKLYSGLPGSGKTTLAREQVKEDGNSARINRDDLRAMMFNSEWTGKREHVVVEVEKAIARVLLENKLTPLVDDTNLSGKHLALWGAVAKQNGAELVIRTLDTPLAECIRRDSQREKPVGDAIINRMALFNGMIDFGDKPIVICDIDGTLADGTHRERHLEGDRKDWKSYFSEMSDDKLHLWVAEELDKVRHTHTICIVSGRPDTYQFQTLEWLRRFTIPFDYIFMRPGGDKRPDTEVKKQILDHLPKAQIVKVWDDRPSVCRMWESEGLNVEWCKGRDCPEF